MPPSKPSGRGSDRPTGRRYADCLDMQRDKGCDGARTIHSLIYDPVDIGSGRVDFKLKGLSDLQDAKLLIIDECSMINHEIVEDLLAYDKPILALGDPAQLPPVFGRGFFIDAEPDFMLTEIHRQARDNPILHLAPTVREGGTLQCGDYGTSRVLPSSEYLTDDDVLGADQVIIGMNKTKDLFNAAMRDVRGFVDIAGLSAVIIL